MTADIWSFQEHDLLMNISFILHLGNFLSISDVDDSFSQKLGVTSVHSSLKLSSSQSRGVTRERQFILFHQILLNS